MDFRIACQVATSRALAEAEVAAAASAKDAGRAAAEDAGEAGKDAGLFFQRPKKTNAYYKHEPS